MPELKTFIVEDSAVILENLVDTLEELDNVKVVGSVSDEASAVRAMREHPQQADLYIIDVFLNQGSGLGVLREAQSLNLRAHCVVLTNYATTDIRRRCKALGAERVFDKSCELDDLIEFCAELSGANSSPAPLV